MKAATYISLILIVSSALLIKTNTSSIEEDNSLVRAYQQSNQIQNGFIQNSTVQTHDFESRNLTITASKSNSAMASCGNRITNGLQVLYDFNEGSGSTVNDVSGVGSALNLTIANPSNTSWTSGGLLISSATIIESATAATKVNNAIIASNAITMEAWVQPLNATQGGPARIMTVSQDWTARNFTLGQEGSKYAARLKTTTTGDQGYPTLEYGPLFTHQLQHIIYTWDGSTGNEFIYIDGVQVYSGTRSGNTSNWNTGYKLAIANEIGLNREWFGEIKLAAVYDRALTSGEVATNFGEGSECAGGGGGYNCNGGTTYDQYAASCTNGDIDINIPNLSNVNETILEVVYKSCDPGANITVSSSIGNITLPKITVSGTSSNVYTYRTIVSGGVTNLSHTPSCGTCFAQNGLQSMIAFAERNMNTGNGYSNILMGRHGYCDVQTISLAIPTANAPRDVNITVPISEVTDDGRYLTLTATSNTGSATDTETIYGSDPSLGECCLAVIELNLTNVPANSTVINIDVISDAANNPNGTGCGQSWDISGTFFFEYECPCTAVTANAGPNKTVCANVNPDVVITGSASGGTSPFTYSWSPTTGLDNPNIAQPTASPTTTTTYTLTVTGDDGCTDTDDVIVYVNSNYTTPGTVTGDESSCGGFDPAIINHVSAPTGGNGGSTIYLWQHRTWTCSTESFGSWTNIASSNVDSYNPAFISSTTEYRRLARRSGCGGWQYGAVVTKEVVDEYTDGGTISGTESNCGTYNPSPITSLTDPSGGCGGIEFYRWYKWEMDCNTGQWISPATLVSGATGLTYDPPSTSVSTRYRRYARRSATCPGTNGVWVISNYVYKYVVSNVTNTGAIDGAEEVCGSYDPSVITITTLPTGGCGADIEYRWFERTQDCATGNWNAWVLIPNSNTTTYDPGTITQTTHYAYHARRGNCPWVGGPGVIKTLNQNFTNAGVISGDETACGSYNPTVITSTSEPSGGCGTFWGIWQKREWNCGTETWSAWSNITGTSNTMTYDPPTITATTEYRRIYTRTGCNPAYVISNTVTKEIVEEYTDGGDIAGTETSCGSFDPGIISNVEDPSGGCGGIQFVRWYKWEMDCATGQWITPATQVPGATGLTYDPPTLNVSTRYRRYSRRSSTCPGTNGVWVVSNYVYKYVHENITDIGVIDGAEEACGSFDPSVITITTLPTGGCGADIEYRWFERTLDCGSSTWNAWVLQPNSNLTTWNPSTISQTTQYTYHVRRGICPWVPAGSVIKRVNENFTDGGTISGDQSKCGGYDPAIINSVSDPSGGCGTYWGVWQQREWNCGPETWSAWGNITGTNAFTYDPPAITVTTQYRRVFVRSYCNPSYLYSNVITKEVIEEFTDGGDISGDETSCGSYDPGVINNVQTPTGGCSGNLEYRWYKWEKDCITGSYSSGILISGATDESYNPPTISTTTRYRRYARRSSLCPGTNSTWMVSNFVYKTVVQNVTTNGTITGDEVACGTLDPAPITFSVPTSGGCEADLEYRWWKQTQNCATGDWNAWELITSGINMDSYDPGPITITTKYSFHVRRGDCDWKYGNSVIKTVNQNYTDGGEVSGDESTCGSFDPAIITSVTEPTGGCGDFWGTWQQRDFDCNSDTWSNWSNISGSSNQMSYDPPMITTTTQYRRLFRRNECQPNYLFSNVITKEVVVPDTDGGDITGAESFCGGYDPTEITSVSLPSGGCGGELAYYWGYRTIDCATGTASAWTNFWGGESYDPGPITQTTEYWRRARRIAGCTPGWLYSNKVLKEVVENYDESGSVQGDETLCGSYDPSIITSVSDPSGGCGGSMDVRWYKWEQDCATGTWGSSSVISGASDLFYDPPTISVSTRYRRYARRAGCTGSDNWIKSNYIYKYVTEDITNKGTITGAEEFCGGYDPTPITFSIPTSGGCNGDLEYKWFKQTRDCTTGDWNAWELITTGIGMDTYDPGPITVTTHYAFHVRRGTCDWQYGNGVIKTVHEDVTDPGTISDDEASCGAFDPANITGTPVSGGCSYQTVQYIWQYREGTSGTFINITGANSTDYNPSSITTTTQYRRAVRYLNCPWTHSNIITKTVSPPATVTISSDQTICDESTASLTSSVSGGSGSVNYQWQKSVNGGNTWNDISGATSANYTTPPLNANTYYRLKTIWPASACTEELSNMVTITVQPSSVVANVIAAKDTLCIGESTVLTVNDGIQNGGLIDYSTWALGQGSSAGFSAIGATNENNRINDNDPWGNSTIVWEAGNDAGSNGDGGWNTSKFAVDHTQTYRYSVWINRKIVGLDGRAYVGVYGYGSTDGVKTVINNTELINAYFWYSANPPTSLATDEWVLVVGHVLPSSHSGNTLHPESGRYTLCDGKIGNINHDYKWLPETVESLHRNYLFYSTDTDVRQQFVYPRVDLIDGTEPSVDDLLNAFDVNGGLGAGASYEWYTGSCGGTLIGTGATLPVTPTVTTTYYVRATGTCNTTACESVTITVGNVTASASNDGDLTCANTSVQLSATPTGLNYDWSGPNGFNSNLENPDVTEGGTYTVTITDNNDCSDIASTTVTENTTPTPVSCQRYRLGYDGVWGSWITLSGSCTVELCVEDGLWDIQLDGGPNIDTGWVWTDEDGNVDSEVDEAVVFSNIGLDDAGVYTGVLTNEYGCESTVTFDVVVNENPIAGASNNGPLTCSHDPVTLSATPSGLTYQWSGPNSFNSALEQPAVSVAGTYYVTVTDANGCSDSTDTEVILDTTPPTVTLDDEDICVGDDATLTASGGVSYLWNTGATTPSITVTPASTTSYSVVVTGTNGCTSTEDATVIVNPLPDNSIIHHRDISCTNALGYVYASKYFSQGLSYSDNSEYISTGGSCGATYLSSNGVSPYSIVAKNLANSVTPGNTYEFNIKYKSSGTGTKYARIVWYTSAWAFISTTSEYITVNNSSWTDFTVSDIAPANAAHVQIGLIVAAPNTLDSDCWEFKQQGGSNIYYEDFETPSPYAWTGPNGIASSSRGAYFAVDGTYSLVITDPVTGCTDSNSITVTADTDPPNASATNDGDITCSSHPTATLTASSSTSGVTYEWSDGAQTATTTTTTPGTYTVTVTDPSNGCTAIAETTVTLESEGAINSITSSCVDQDITVNYTMNGTTNEAWIGIYAVGAANSNFIDWDWVPTIPGTDDLVFSNHGIAAGTYEARLFAGIAYEECAIETFTLNALPTATASNNGPITCAHPTVTLTALPAGLSYSWTGPGGFISNLESPDITVAGTYEVEVTDSNGCTNNVSTIVTENTTPTPVFCDRYRFGYDGVWGDWITFSGSCIIELCEADGLWDIQFDGGPNIDTGWVWTDEDGNVDGEVDETVLFANIGLDDAGIYTGVLTNEYGCESTVTFEVVVYESPTVTLNITNNNVCIEDGIVNLSGTPSNGTYSGTGVIGATFDPAIAGIGEHTIFYSFTDGNGCSDSTSASITVHNLTLDLGDDIQICEDENTEIIPIITNSDPNLNYSWEGPNGFSANTPTITVSNEGIYFLTISDTYGCSAFDYVAIYNLDLYAGVIQTPDIQCPGNDPDIIASLEPASYCNIISNPQFDDGVNDWTFGAVHGAVAERSIDANSALSGENSTFVDISTITGTAWHVYVLQGGLSVQESKTYDLSFEAVATGAKSINVTIQENQAPYTSYASQSFTIGTSPSTFTFNNINPNVNHNNVRVMFSLGGNQEDIWIDNVKFKESDCTEPTIEYTWESRISNGSGGWSAWSTIAGATSTTYDPPTQNTLMQYRRLSRVQGCSDYYSSNEINVSICPTPFDCDAKFYQTLRINGDFWLYEITTVPTVSIQPIFNLTQNGAEGNINNAAFNKHDGFIYVTTTTPPYRFYRLGSNHVVQYLGNVDGLPTSTSTFAADFGANETIIYRGTLNSTIYELNLNTLVATEICDFPDVPANENAIGDFAYNHLHDKFYGVRTGSNELIAIDINNCTKQTITTDITFGSAVGSFFTSTDGYGYGYENTTGDLYRINLITGETGLVGSGSVSAQTDGAYCGGLSFQKESNVEVVNCCNVLTYEFKLYNSWREPISNANFNDVLTDGLTWASEPYDVSSLSIGATAITGNSTANFTLTNIPIGLSSFKIDVEIPMDYSGASTYNNQAVLSNLPANLTSTISSDDPSTVALMDATSVTITCNPPVVNAGDDVSICLGDSTTLIATATNGTGNINYSWDNGLGNGHEHTVNPIVTTVYTVTVTDDESCEVTDQVTVSVNTIPQVSFELPNDFLCLDAGVIILSGGTPVNGNYSGPGVTDNNFDPSVAGIGTHTISYEYSDPNGCTDIVTDVIEVLSLPSVTFSLTNNSICTHQGVITLTGGSPVNGEYSGPGVTGSEFDPVAAGVGTHTITYTFTDINGCVDIAADDIEVFDSPIVSLSLTDAIACVSANSLTLSGGQPSGGTYSGPTVSGNTFNPSAAGIGAHLITYSYTTNEGCTVDANQYLIVNALPQITLENETICNGDTITLSPDFCESYVDIIAQRPLLHEGWQNTFGEGGSGITGDGELCFTLDEANLTSANMFGLNDLPFANKSYGEMEYAIYILIRHEHANPYLMQIRENGESVASPYNSTTSYVGSTFCIKRTGTTIEYLKDGVVMYTSTVPSTGKIHYDHSIHSNDGIYTNGYSKFTDISLCGSVDYNCLWSNGETTDSIQVHEANTYTIQVTNINGCNDSEQATVLVNSIPSASATVEGPITCENTSVQLTALPTDLIYTWNGPNNYVNSSRTPNVSVPGTYDLTIYDFNIGCYEYLSVDVLLESQGAITAINNGCENEDISIDYTIDGSETQAWIGLYEVGGANANFLEWSYVPTIPGSGTVTFSDHSLTGGTYEARLYSTAGYILCESEQFTLDSTPDIVLTSDGGFTCEDSDVQLTAMPIDLIYLWNGPNSYVSSSRTPTVSDAGMYVVTVTDPATSCAAVDSIEVFLESAGSIDQIQSSCNYDVISVDYTIAGNEPQAWIGIYNTGSLNNNFIVWSWVPTIPGSGTVEFTDHDLPPGTYEARLFSTAGYIMCESETFTYGQEPDCLISGRMLVEENTQNEIYSAAPNMNYAWSIISGDASIDGNSNGQNVTIDFGVANSTLQLVLTSAEGCSSTCSIEIEMSPEGKCSFRDEFIYQAFDNSDGTEDWSNNSWTEIGDDGDPIGGDIVFVSQKLRLDNDDSSLPAIVRDVDLSTIANALLTFNYNQGSADLESDDVVEVHIYDGTSWHVVLSDTGTIPPNSSPTIDISMYANADTKIKITIASGYADVGEYVFFDNVTLTGDCIVPEICGDGIDNDFDGLEDCEDPDCSSYVDCVCQKIITNRHIYFKTRITP